MSMRICAVWSWHSLFIDMHYNVHWSCKRTMQALISLRICAGWSGPALSANCIRAIFVRCASNCFYSLGWSDVPKVSCILHHWGVQLILAFSWARPAILVAGKGRGGWFCFFCFFTYILVLFLHMSLSFVSSTISSISFLPFSGRRHKMTHKGRRFVKPQHNQSMLL